MSKLQSKTVATYSQGGPTVQVDLCWAGGDDPWQDEDVCYDFSDASGAHLNANYPWYLDGDKEVPSEEAVREFLYETCGWADAYAEPFHLRLILDVTFSGDCDPELARENLGRIAEQASERGQLTEDLTGVVNDWTYCIEEVENEPFIVLTHCKFCGTPCKNVRFHQGGYVGEDCGCWDERLKTTE